MIYSQAFRNESFSPAVALFGAAGLIKTTGKFFKLSNSFVPKKLGNLICVTRKILKIVCHQLCLQ